MGSLQEGPAILNRRSALGELYELIDELRAELGGPRTLAACDGRMGWPRHGVYLFFEADEHREDGITPRVTRVGTHALTETSRTSMWSRLAQHRGSVGGRTPGGGNHRGSIFRLHVGTALIARDGWSQVADWGRGGSASRGVREREVELERAVSRTIGAMPFLWLAADDRHDRAVIERDLIALLSNADRPGMDPPSPEWLGRHADRPAIRTSGLWNVDHTTRQSQNEGLDRFRSYVCCPQR